VPLMFSLSSKVYCVSSILTQDSVTRSTIGPTTPMRDAMETMFEACKAPSKSSDVTAAPTTAAPMGNKRLPQYHPLIPESISKVLSS